MENPVFKVYVDLGGKFALESINEESGKSMILDKMDRGETWYNVCPIRESIRDERALDSAMKEFGIHHFWERKYEGKYVCSEDAVSEMSSDSAAK